LSDRLAVNGETAPNSAVSAEGDSAPGEARCCSPEYEVAEEATDSPYDDANEPVRWLRDDADDSDPWCA